MAKSKIKITSAPSAEVWYATQIGKKFKVVYEYETHFEVESNARKWPSDVCLLVPVEDCILVKGKKGGDFHRKYTDTPKYVVSTPTGQRPWWYYQLSPAEQAQYEIDEEDRATYAEMYRWY